MTDIEVYGYITTADGKPLTTVKTAIVDLRTMKQITAFYTGNDQYSAWEENYAEQRGVLFVANGYKPLVVPFTTLAINPDVVLEPADFPMWMILAVLAAITTLQLMSRKKRKKQIGAIERKDLTIIFLLVGGVIAFSVIKKILESIGLWNSQDTKDLDNAMNDPGSWWNPNFWQTKPSNIPWSYAITESQAEQYARTLYNAFGPFNDNEEQAIGVFKACRTQANASFICWKFQQIYGEDCLKFLRGGWWPQDRLSDADVNEINKFVNRLPKY